MAEGPCVPTEDQATARTVARQGGSEGNKYSNLSLSISKIYSWVPSQVNPAKAREQGALGYTLSRHQPPGTQSRVKKSRQ